MIYPDGYFVLTQAIGWAASALLVAAFWCTSDRQMNWMMTSGFVAMAVHMGLLGAWVIAASFLFGVVRNMAILRWQAPITITVLASLATLAVALPIWEGALSVITVLAGVLTNWALVTQQGVKLRLLLLPISCMWLVAAYLAGSTPAMAAETLVMGGNAWTAWLLLRGPKRDLSDGLASA